MPLPGVPRHKRVTLRHAAVRGDGWLHEYAEDPVQVPFSRVQACRSCFAGKIVDVGLLLDSVTLSTVSLAGGTAIIPLILVSLWPFQKSWGTMDWNAVPIAPGRRYWHFDGAPVASCLLP